MNADEKIRERIKMNDLRDELRAYYIDVKDTQQVLWACEALGLVFMLGLAALGHSFLSGLPFLVLILMYHAVTHFSVDQERYMLGRQLHRQQTQMEQRVVRERLTLITREVAD